MGGIVDRSHKYHWRNRSSLVRLSLLSHDPTVIDALCAKWWLPSGGSSQNGSCTCFESI